MYHEKYLWICSKKPKEAPLTDSQSKGITSSNLTPKLGF